MHYKGIYLVNRNPALSLEEFPQRWQQHAKLAGSQKELRKYFTSVIQCMRLLDAGFPADTAAGYDAMNLVGISSLEAGTALWDEPATINVMQPDELKTFSRLIVECWMVGRERVIRSGPPGSVVVVRCLKRRPDVDLQSFREHFATVHAGLESAGSTGALVLRQVQNEIAVAPPDFDYDLVNELWFADVDSARRHFADATLQDCLAADRNRLCQTSSITMTAQVSLCQGAITQAS